MNTLEKDHLKIAHTKLLLPSRPRYPIPEDTTQKLSKDKKKRVQQGVGSILYYVQGVDITLLITLSTIAAEQSKPLWTQLYNFLIAAQHTHMQK